MRPRFAAIDGVRHIDPSAPISFRIALEEDASEPSTAPGRDAAVGRASPEFSAVLPGPKARRDRDAGTGLPSGSGPIEPSLRQETADL